MDVALLRRHLKRAVVRRTLPAPGERRRIRESAGLSQFAVAEVLGTTQVNVSRWETGAREPSDAFASDYAELLRYLQDSVEEVPA